MNIVSVSVFGNVARYIVGAHAQYRLAKQYFPGWEFRLYTDDASRFCLPDATVIEVKDGSYGSFWRFFPAFESDANVVLFRDADSRIGAREAMAVFEWMDSGKRFHSIKDHPNHTNTLLAGMSASRGRFSQGVLENMKERMFSKRYYGADEEFMEQQLFPLVKDDMVEHVWNKGWFGLSRKHLKNRYEFVGNGFDENELPIYPPTAEEREGYDRFKLPESAKFCGYYR